MDDESGQFNHTHHHHQHLHPQPHQDRFLEPGSNRADLGVERQSSASSPHSTVSPAATIKEEPLPNETSKNHVPVSNPELNKPPSPPAMPTWDSIRAQVRAFHAVTMTLPVLQTPSDFHFDGNRLYFLAINGNNDGNAATHKGNAAVDTNLSPSSTSPVGVHSNPLLSNPANHVTSSHFKKKAVSAHLPHSHHHYASKQHTLCWAELPELSSSTDQQQHTMNDTLSEESAQISWKSLLPGDWSLRHSQSGGVSSREEQLLKERKRISSQGILSYQGIRKGPSRSQFLFPLANQLFCGTTDGTGSFDISEVKANKNAAGVRLDAQMGGKESRLIAFIRHRNLWVTDGTGTEQQLTFASESGLSCGIAEYVMQEEFRRFTGYWWKPVTPSGNEFSKSNRILFMEVDERQVEWIYITRPGLDEEPDWYRYPRVGKPNATSTPKIVEFNSPSGDGSPGSVVHYSLPEEFSLKRLFPWCEYIVRAGWLPDGKSIWLQLLDRGQKRAAIIRIPESLFTRQTYPIIVDSTVPEDAQIQVLCEETSPYWINITDIISFLKTDQDSDVVSFIIASERTGFRHLYRVKCFLNDPVTAYLVPRIPQKSSIAANCYVYPKCHTWQITTGEWQVVDHDIWVDEKRQLVYYIGKKDTPLETHLYVSSYRPDLTLPVAPFSPDGISEETPTMIPSSHLERNIHLLTKLGFSHTIYLDVESSKFVSVFSSIKEAPQTHIYDLQFVADDHRVIRHDADIRPVLKRARSTSSVPNGMSKKVHLSVATDERVSAPTSDCNGIRSSPNLSELSSDDFGQYLCDHIFPSSRFRHKLVPQTRSDKVDGTSPDINALFHEKIPLPELFSFINSDGVKIHGLVYKPVNFVEGRSYPTILRIYGGPNVQIVTNDFKFPKLNRMFMALKFGFVVVMIDSRGSYDRGLLFESYIQHRMGTVELQDQIEALLFLATKGQLMLTPRPRDHSNPADHSLIALWNQVSIEKKNGRYNGFIDMDRITVTGWSYGGYLSLMALCQYPSIFKMSLAGAPVTSWELYDTAYTERYMGIIEENREGYIRGSVLQYVDTFPDTENRLLIVHGLIDENVHFKNTEVLVSGLARCSKPHQVQVYPSERHGLRAGNVIEHFETLMFWWFQSYL